MKQKVVIIGHGFTSRLAIIRSLGQLDYDVTVIVMTPYNRDGKTLNIVKPIVCYSRYVSRTLYCHLLDGEGLIRILLENCTDTYQKVVIIPDSDVTAVIIDNNQALLESHFLFPHIHHKSGAVAEWMDKKKQKDLAYKLGLNVATAEEIEIKDGNYTLPATITYPCFTKPMATVNGGKKYLRRCDNQSELKDLLDGAGNKEVNIRIMVEKFMPIEKEFAVVGFSDGQNVVIPGIIQIIEMSHGGHLGVACQGRVMPMSGFDELKEQFSRLILEIGFVGLFDIDFYQSDGAVYFGELNLRFGGSGYAFTKLGVNLPAMLVKSLCNESLSEMPTYIDDTAIYANERMCLDDWYFGFISTSEYHRIIRESDINFVYDSEDLVPQQQFQREFKKRYVKRLIKRFLKIKLNS